ncbi:hypothetical protein [Millisia brevis]|uniref:hypothetical protein n=1 Tax=Millisia brevis TaxID=264148 RepID=UPI0008368AE6|nr:hypothetical protein [Millisia brevis]
MPIVGRRVATDSEVVAAFTAWLESVGGGQRPIFVSDNPAYDWQWISAVFDTAMQPNPFGHSGRRLGDFYAGLMPAIGGTPGVEAAVGHAAYPPPGR